MKQPQLEAWLIPNNPDDDKESEFNMNEFRREAEDYQNNILHEMTLRMEDMIDQGLDDLIREEAPTQMVNLIF